MNAQLMCTCRHLAAAGGVLLSYSNLAFPSTCGRIFNEHPEIHVTVTFDALVFAPQPETVLGALLMHIHVCISVLRESVCMYVCVCVWCACGAWYA